MKTLTKKQIQDLQDDLIATMPTYTHFNIDDLCNMALRYRDLLDAEVVGVVQKHTGSLKDMAIIVWTGAQPSEGTKLIVAPREE